VSIRRFYDRWPQYNRRLTEVVEAMTDEQLAIRPAPERDPVWATVGHTAGARTYWLCTVVGEPGADTTPWPDPTSESWEDDPGRPRTAAELVWALDSTWAIVDGCLDRWTPEMLDETIERRHANTLQAQQAKTQRPGPVAPGQLRTLELRRLQQFLPHQLQLLRRQDRHQFRRQRVGDDALRCLGIRRLPQIDLWRPD